MEELPPSPPQPPPRSRAHWFLLLLPAVEMLLVSAAANVLGRHLDGDGYGGLTVLIYNLFVFAALCLVLGIWWHWRNPHLGARILFGILAALGIAAVNGLISFAGCSMGLLK